MKSTGGISRRFFLYLSEKRESIAFATAAPMLLPQRAKAEGPAAGLLCVLLPQRAKADANLQVLRTLCNRFHARIFPKTLTVCALKKYN